MRLSASLALILLLLACAPKPTLPPQPSLTPLPYHAYELSPEPGAKGVSITTSISLTLSRPPEIVDIKLEPPVEISHVVRETVGLASGRFTFYPAHPLKPNTTYKVTITYGQRQAPEGYRPTSTISWQFTTAPH